MWKGQLYKIKKGKEQQWFDWCALLMDKHYEEALKTLKEEHYLEEQWIIFQMNGQWFTLGLGRKGDPGGSVNKERKLNQEHYKTKQECLERVNDQDGVSMAASIRL